MCFYNVNLTELEMHMHLCFQPGGVGFHGLWRLEVMAAEKGAPVHLWHLGVLLRNTVWVFEFSQCSLRRTIGTLCFSFMRNNCLSWCLGSAEEITCGARLCDAHWNTKRKKPLGSSLV